MNEDFMMQLDDMHLQQAQAVRRPTLLNIAAAQLRKVGGGGGGGAPAALLCRPRAVLSLSRCAPLQAGLARHDLEQRPTCASTAALTASCTIKFETFSLIEHVEHKFSLLLDH